MKKYDVMTLITETVTRDDLGIEKVTETRRDVLCEVSSITASEMAAYGQKGLKPEKQLKTFRGNYEGEELVEYQGVKYRVYRTYEDGMKVELYLTLRKGSES